MSLTDGRTVADPFARTADVVALLRLRARRSAQERRAVSASAGRLGFAASSSSSAEREVR